MNKLHRNIALSALTLALLSACASPMVESSRQTELRTKLTALQNDPVLSLYAPQARAEAEAAVNKVEQPQTSTQLTMHHDFVAHRKIEIAEAKAREAHLLAEQEAMSGNTSDARLASRTAEADDANRRAARMAAELEALNAKPTPRGMLLTLGDVLFATGQSTLSPGAGSNLSKLYDFLSNNPETRLAIEGHTDNVGSAQSNLDLSQNRAFAVSAYLQNRGVSNKRLAVKGMGEDSPVASNASASGRQMNRRVEITILNQ